MSGKFVNKDILRKLYTKKWLCLSNITNLSSFKTVLEQTDILCTHILLSLDKWYEESVLPMMHFSSLKTLLVSSEEWQGPYIWKSRRVQEMPRRWLRWRTSFSAALGSIPPDFYFNGLLPSSLAPLSHPESIEFNRDR